MNATGKNELDKVEDEHCKRVFERYETRSNSFRRLLIGLIGLSLAFYFFILFPYVLIQRKNYRIDEQLKNLTGEINPQKVLVKAYETVQNGIKSLRDEIDNFPNNLRDFILSLEIEIKEIRQEREFPAQQMAQQRRPGPCDSLSDDEWVNCKIRHEILSQFSGYRRILNQEVAVPLQAIGGKTTTLIIDQDKFKKQFEKLQTSFETKLDKKPLFWKNFSDKVNFSVELRKEVNEFWKEYDSIVKAESHKLEDELKILRTNMTNLKGKQTYLNNENTRLNNRLSAIEFPLGNFPVGLNDSVLLFPVVVAIGFLVCTFLFCETVRLRKAFHNQYPNKDQITLIAPLWIDPANPEQNKPLRLTVLFSPIAFFAGAISLNWYIRTISEDLTGASQFNWWVYIGLYVLSLGVFIYGCWQVGTELRRYSGG